MIQPVLGFTADSLSPIAFPWARAILSAAAGPESRVQMRRDGGRPSSADARYSMPAPGGNRRFGLVQVLTPYQADGDQ